MSEDYHERGPIRSFLNLEGIFERGETASRAGSLMTKSNKGTGVTFTRFQGKNYRRIQFEITCIYSPEENTFTFTYIVSSLGQVTEPMANRKEVLSYLKKLGGYLPPVDKSSLSKSAKRDAYKNIPTNKKLAMLKSRNLK